MVPEFDTCVFDENNAPGSPTVYQVKTQFGHHLIQVLERSSKA